VYLPQQPYPATGKKKEVLTTVTITLDYAQQTKERESLFGALDQQFRSHYCPSNQKPAAD
jgi:hypothetical protein